MPSARYNGPLATIADIRVLGINGFGVTCSHCYRTRKFGFDELRLEARVVFSHIPHVRRFVCTGCGWRKVSMMPDWLQVSLRGDGTRPVSDFG